ncbi:bactofilin family protein [Polycyclovorans algicola]|uniref:bactofilin family protein n=1 Tax=Polycyclovorans algicola TaxID=616992 RepID=UPI0009FCA505|nr:polymer-forming cytoskeletal protein [Polycyclovorans algicola]
MSKLFGGNTSSPASPSKGGSTVDTLIGRQTEISGDVRFSGGLHVDGKVRGKVLAAADKSAELSVSDSGLIEGDVRVPNIMLNGGVVGDVYASERLRMSSKARVTGNVSYKVIEMEAGATVNGQMIHESGDALASLGPNARSKTPDNDEPAAIGTELPRSVLSK